MGPDDFAFFRREPSGFAPLDLARSLWSRDQLHGVAVSGLLAVALEETVARIGRSELVPARYHVDLFRPATMTLTTTRTSVVRSGPRLTLIDAEVLQDGERVARATCTYLLPTDAPPGTVWHSTERAAPPPLEVAPVSDAPHVPLFASDSPWSDDFSQHQNGGRHRTWQSVVPPILGETPSTFCAAASIADSTSMVVNWGSAGVEYINTDISLALSRRPVSLEIGLAAVDHVAHDGIAVGVAEVFDRGGSLGTATVTSLANTKRTVDLAAAPDYEAPTTAV